MLSSAINNLGEKYRVSLFAESHKRREDGNSETGNLKHRRVPRTRFLPQTESTSRIHALAGAFLRLQRFVHFLRRILFLYRFVMRVDDDEIGEAVPRRSFSRHDGG